MTPEQLKEIRERAENAKLSSDDHGHDCTALREYCEHEVIWAYDTAVPALLDYIAKLEFTIKWFNDNWPGGDPETDFSDLVLEHLRKVNSKRR